ncbi:MAG: ATP-binding protein [Mucilaginibacter sp.]|uniref:tetratricopeptide repeat-containing sensor histidine kinase n=1 Tax=Mucilaginibacter sp. TaxID=1882438 RepID=UPI0031AA9093
MKKLLLSLLLIPLLFFSCRKQENQMVADYGAAYHQAYQLLEVNRDSAFLHFNRLAENTKDRRVAALAAYNMALIQSDAGDHYGAQESLTMSLRSLDERRPEDRDYLATDFNELAMSSYALREYAASLAYCEQALSYTRAPELLQYILTNQGNAFQKLQRYGEALASYRRVIALCDRKGTVYARALTNLATTLWLRNRHYDAALDLCGALAIRVREKDTWGQNSSFAHLADFYMVSRPDSALYYADKMLVMARRLKSADDELEALQKLARLANPVAVRPYFLRYQALSDSLMFARKAAKNQFAMIRYDTEKNKADNLRLQQENTTKKYQLTALIGLIASGTAAGIFLFRIRRERMKRAADQRVQETKLLLSRKVHDVVANGIYRVMNEVEYGEQLVREDLLDQLETMYERSRDIAHESDQRSERPFSAEIAELAGAFKSRSIRLAVTGNEESLWQKVSDPAKAELIPVLQELLVNMQKHSGAGRAHLSFDSGGGYLLVTYRDNGIGIADMTSGGRGLKNTVSRIRSVGGSITFANQAVKGVQVHLTMPLV